MAFSLGEKGALKPIIGLWLPNIVVGGMGWYLFWVTWKEKEIKWLTGLKNFLDWVKEALKKGKR
jgi:hypothetical protein